MTHPIIAAAAEFQNDEKRRKRKRMPVEARMRLDRTLNAVQHQEQDVIDYARRGEVVVELFDYRDTFDSAAATVITEILWAAQAHGYQPLAILQEAWDNFTEDKGRDQSPPDPDAA